VLVERQRCQSAGTVSDTEGEVLDSRSLVRPHCLCGPAHWSQKTDQGDPVDDPEARVARLLCVHIGQLDRVSLVGDMLDLTGRRTAVHAGSQRSGAPASSSRPNFSSSFTIPPPWALLV
jgi:hypothetical protein